jgi:hypothetical protein
MTSKSVLNSIAGHFLFDIRNAEVHYLPKYQVCLLIKKYSPSRFSMGHVKSWGKSEVLLKIVNLETLMSSPR